MCNLPFDKCKCIGTFTPSPWSADILYHTETTCSCTSFPIMLKHKHVTRIRKVMVDSARSSQLTSLLNSHCLPACRYHLHKLNHILNLYLEPNLPRKVKIKISFPPLGNAHTETDIATRDFVCSGSKFRAWRPIEHTSHFQLKTALVIFSHLPGCSYYYLVENSLVTSCKSSEIFVGTTYRKAYSLSF